MKKLGLVALGLLLVACGTNQVSLQGSEPTRVAARATTSPLNGERALAHVAYLTERKLAGRMTASEGDALADEYLVKHFQGLGLNVTLQPFTHPQFRGTANNVIAMLPAREKTDRYVVVGAHKDHLGQRGGKIYYGANDNAGGTAAVMEIAQVLAERAKRGEGLKANVLFMAFSGEELGLLGSAFYTRNPIAPSGGGKASPIALKQIGGMVNLDCIAVGNTNSLGTDTVEVSAQSTRTLQAIAKRHGMTSVFAPFKVPHGTREHAHEELPPGASSDHAAFRRAGVRAICYYAEPVFSKYLHTPNDTIPARDEIKKAPADQFNIDNLVRIGGVGLDTLTTWASE